MTDDWRPPDGHPISPEQANKLMAGSLGNMYRRILAGCCLPIYWHPIGAPPSQIIDNGTVTLVKPNDTVFGITAAHVVLGYQEHAQQTKTTLRLWDEEITGLEIIDLSEPDKHDLATFAIEPALLERIRASRNFQLVPLTQWPPRSPEEGRGIMFGGYPGVERRGHENGRLEWGFFSALGISRRVGDDQITWLMESDWKLESSAIPSRFGGLSGGPMIGWFESPNYITHFALSGIISEAHDDFGNVVAKTADCINDDGTIDL